jgi:hypothetical protein
MSFLTIVLIAVIMLAILGIGFSAFWDGLVRGFNIAKDRAEGFVEEERKAEKTTSLPLQPTFQNV